MIHKSRFQVIFETVLYLYTVMYLFFFSKLFVRPFHTALKIAELGKVDWRYVVMPEMLELDVNCQ